LVLTWGLTALSFFLDLYRVANSPGLLFVVCRLSPKNRPLLSHFDFRLSSESGTNPPFTPADLLGRAVERNEPIILVAAAVGGIQSAAWTAQVLTGIEEHCLRHHPKIRFSQAVKLLSGVSGGSVGSMFFAATYQGGWRFYRRKRAKRFGKRTSSMKAWNERSNEFEPGNIFLSDIKDRKKRQALNLAA
jgi:hypothetical protein